MRLALQLKPKTDTVWRQSDTYKIRGNIWNAIKGTKYESLHDASDIPTFTFSNIYPVDNNHNINETIPQKTKCTILIDSPHPSLIDVLYAYYKNEKEINIGDTQYQIDDIETRNYDIGPVGSTGTLKTPNGIYLRLPPEEQEKYELNKTYDDVISWTPKHGLNPFQNRIIDNLNWKVNTLSIKNIKTPDSFNDVFDSVSFITTYESKINVNETYSKTFIPTVCEFDYTIQNQSQRLWLNTILESGLGWRNALGFGFVNIK